MRGTFSGAKSAALLAAIALSAGAPAAAQTYDIQTILPLTGGAAFTGQAAHKFLEVSTKLVNETGGIQGRNVRLVYHDSSTSPQNALQLFTRIAATGAPVVLGPQITAECGAVAPLIRKGPVSWCMSPGVHPPAGSYMFSSMISTADNLRTLIRYLRLKGWTRIATLVTTDASGQDAERAILEAAKLPENASVKIVAAERFAPTDITVSAQIEAMRSAHPQALIAWAIGSPEGTILRGVAQAGWKLPVVLGQGSAVVSFMRQFAAVLPEDTLLPEGLGAVRGPGLDLEPDVVAARQVYFAALDAAKLKPEVGGESAWDGSRIVFDALRHAGPNATAAEIRDYIAHLTHYAGASGIYDFGKYPQRGLGGDEAVVARWNPKSEFFEPVSQLGGAPLR